MVIEKGPCDCAAPDCGVGSIHEPQCATNGPGVFCICGAVVGGDEIQRLRAKVAELQTSLTLAREARRNWEERAKEAEDRVAGMEADLIKSDSIWAAFLDDIRGARTGTEGE
uniref:Uncharacterized protein n=1 Tax=viral metagenome TaxID=1070528 RepID=A0A6M3LGW3_9ZZZZ